MSSRASIQAVLGRCILAATLEASILADLWAEDPEAMVLGDVDLDQPLSGSEDPKLSEEMLMLDSYRSVEYTKPPGITSLREWGCVIIPSGKHRLKSHDQVFSEDLGYCLPMSRKTSLSSPWALSLKNYVIHPSARLQLLAG